MATPKGCWVCSGLDVSLAAAINYSVGITNSKFFVDRTTTIYTVLQKHCFTVMATTSRSRLPGQTSHRVEYFRASGKLLCEGGSREARIRGGVNMPRRYRQP
jgi:hypothetical protein